jgi:hypothetical protein
MSVKPGQAQGGVVMSGVEIDAEDLAGFFEFVLPHLDEKRVWWRRGDLDVGSWGSDGGGRGGKDESQHGHRRSPGPPRS